MESRVTVRLSTPFREVTGGKGEVEGRGANLEELFERLDVEYPGFKRLIFAEDGAVRDYAHIFINGEDYRMLGGLSASLSGGEVVSVLFAISGG